MRTTFVGSVLLSLLLMVPDVGAMRQDSAAARRAAEAWLALVDGGDYAESWETAAAYFRGQVTESVWADAMRGARDPLGAVRSRSVNNTTAATTLPGAPDGDYRVFQFSTSFAEKEYATETLTTVLEEDGVWRVTGYFIR